MKTNLTPIDELVHESTLITPIQTPIEMEGVATLPPNSPLFQLADEQPRLPSYIPRGPSFPSLTAEERVLISSLMEMNPDAGYTIKNGEAVPIFTPRYPFALNGQPDEVTRRRVYCTIFQACPECGGSSAWWIDRYYLTLGTYCSKCHADSVKDSWAAFQWRRRPENAILSDYDGFIANDPLLKDVSVWKPNQLFSLGSGMRTGKTTFIFLKADQIVRQSPAVRFIYLGARVSQVKGIYAENCGTYQGKQKWGLFHEGSEKGVRIIGTHGAISTISSLQIVMDKMQEDIEDEALHPSWIHLIVDEVDFGAELMNASIMKELKVENKELLRNAILTNGIVVAGQTENLISLECLALELGIPVENILGYYKQGNMENALVTIYDYEHQDGMKSYQIACVVERCKEVIKTGKRPYVFCQGRRTAQIIASFFNKALIYDAYERGKTHNRALLYNQKAPSSYEIVVTSCAVDVGISIKDPDGYSITVMDQNLRYHNGVASPAQQMVRDRNPNPREFHNLPYENRLPTSHSFNVRTGLVNMRYRLHDEESEEEAETVVNHLATRAAVNELSDFQLINYLEYQMKYAGFQVEKKTPTPPENETIIAVKERRKEILEWEKSVIEVRAKSIITWEASHWKVYEEEEQSPFEKLIPISEEEAAYDAELTEQNIPLSSDDIRKLGTRNLLKPVPYEQLSHERAWEACSAVGFKPTSSFELHQQEQQFEDEQDMPADMIEDTSQPLTPGPEQTKAAIAFLAHRISYDEFYPQKLGYLAVHHEQVIHDIWKNETGETTHRIDYRRVGFLLQKLLYHLPKRKVITEQEFYTALRAAISEHYGDSGQLKDLLASGGLGKANATKFRFYNHDEPMMLDDGKLSLSAERLMEWGLDFLPHYYPCQLARRGSAFIFRRSETWDIKIACIDADLEFGRKLEKENLKPSRRELMPYEVETLDFTPELTSSARTLRKQGMTHKDIAEQLNAPYAVIYGKAKDIKRQTKIEAAELDILSVMKPGLTYTPRSLKAGIRSESTRKLIAPVLKRLLNAERIEKVRHGAYRRKT